MWKTAIKIAFAKNKKVYIGTLCIVLSFLIALLIHCWNNNLRLRDVWLFLGMLSYVSIKFWVLAYEEKNKLNSKEYRAQVD